MLHPTLGLGLATLLAAPPPQSDSSRDEAPTDAVEAPQFVEDMPDPHAEEWEPPPGPTRPPPQSSPAANHSQAPGPSSSGASSSELPPSSAGPSPSSATTAAKHGQRLQVAGLVFGGAGIIGMAVGGYMFDQAQKTRSALANEQALLDVGGSTPADVAELESKLADQQKIMTIGLIAGGSSLGLAAILFITGTITKKRAAAPTVSISGGPQLVGLSVSGRF
jgi:enamine deaminase RidA (YjgF/YER057c/UK114 family)